MNKLSSRTWTFIFTGIGLLALLLLAASINTLQLAPGQTVSFQDALSSMNTTGGSTDFGNIALIAFRIVMVLLWLTVPLYIILAMLDKDMRGRLLRDIVMLLVVMVLLLILSNQKQPEKAAEDINPAMFSAESLDMGDMSSEGAPPPEFVPPPAWVTTAATAAIAASVAGIIGAVVYGIWRRSRNQRNLREPLLRVEREAQAAIDAIGAGGDLREVVMRSYLQMIEALKEYRGIHRSYDMTPHEFEIVLEKRGMPASAVHQLTQLFEQVRYGGTKPGRKDEQAAIASLSAIVSACQKTRSV